MANLEYRYGPMNSGKSMAILQMAYNYEENGKKVLLVKSVVDTKGGDYLVSRIGPKRLFELADKFKELETICHCGKKARFNARKVDGKFATKGEDHVIDDDPKHIEYVPLCGSCYLKEVLNK